jgi:hypothetical protein
MWKEHPKYQASLSKLNNILIEKSGFDKSKVPILADILMKSMFHMGFIKLSNFYINLQVRNLAKDNEKSLLIAEHLVEKGILKLCNTRPHYNCGIHLKDWHTKSIEDTVVMFTCKKCGVEEQDEDTIYETDRTHCYTCDPDQYDRMEEESKKQDKEDEDNGDLFCQSCSTKLNEEEIEHYDCMGGAGSFASKICQFCDMYNINFQTKIKSIDVNKIETEIETSDGIQWYFDEELMEKNNYFSIINTAMNAGTTITFSRNYDDIIVGVKSYSS